MVSNLDNLPYPAYRPAMAGWTSLKAAIRDRVPARLQVPVKYHYLKARGLLEAELALLPLLIGRGQLALDIGANFGSYSYALARLGAGVEMFEPNPQIAAVLAAWAKRQRDIHVHAVALSDNEGSATLVIPCDTRGTEHDSSASIAPGFSASGRHVAVPTRRLDSYQFSAPTLIKIDVEGHEAAVLTGARKTIAAHLPALVVEIEQRHIERPIGDALGEVLAMGYRGAFLCDGQLLPLERFDPARHQSAEGFASADTPYCNNFIFIAQARVDRGDYADLLKRMAA